MSRAGGSRFSCRPAGNFPGRGPDSAQELRVTFSAEAGGTRVTLVHAGWERLGDQGPASRASYEQGWDLVLGAYIQLAVEG